MSVKVELRSEIDKHLVDAIDGAVAGRRDSNRTKILTEILEDWMARMDHEAMMYLRVRGINPFDSEGGRK
jgi:hypothetical protein